MRCAPLTYNSILLGVDPCVDGRMSSSIAACGSDVLKSKTILFPTTELPALYNQKSIVKSPVASSDTEWTNPSQPPESDLTYRLVEEAPYYEVVQRSGQTQTDALLVDNEYAGFLIATAANDIAALNALLNVDAGSGYYDYGIIDYSPHAFLDEDVVLEAGPSTFAITGAGLSTVTDPCCPVDASQYLTVTVFVSSPKDIR